MNSGEKLDLGLAVLSVVNPGERLSLGDIADICGVSKNMVWVIERKALAKLGQRLVAENPSFMAELIGESQKPRTPKEKRDIRASTTKKAGDRTYEN